MTVDEAAARLGIARETLSRWIARGVLVPYTIGTRSDGGPLYAITIGQLMDAEAKASQRYWSTARVAIYRRADVKP